MSVRKGGGEDFHQSPGFVTYLHYNFHRARAITSIELELEQNHTMSVRKGGRGGFPSIPGVCYMFAL